MNIEKRETEKEREKEILLKREIRD